MKITLPISAVVIAVPLLICASAALGYLIGAHVKTQELTASFKAHEQAMFDSIEQCSQEVNCVYQTAEGAQFRFVLIPI